MDCTIVPWESLTSMVISLALVYGIHQWPVIKWFLPCSTSTHVITWSDSYFGWRDWRPWITSLWSRLRWSIHDLWHIDPLCMIRGYVILTENLSHRSTVYSSGCTMLWLHGSTVYDWWPWPFVYDVISLWSEYGNAYLKMDICNTLLVLGCLQVSD